MKKTLLLTLAALLGLALCAAAAAPARVAPTDPGPVTGPAALLPRQAAVAGVAGATDVQNLRTGSYFATIQAAIDDAGTVAGDVLEVQVATHAEGICTVNKAVTIQGVGGGAAITSTTDTGTSGDARAWFLVTVSGVTFKDLTFDGSANLVWQALRFKEAGAVTNCTFQHIKSAPAAYNGVGIVGYKNLTVTDCTLSDIGRIGIILFGPDVTAGTVSGCAYTGKGVGDWIDYGIELGGGAVAALTNNTITACTGVALVDGSVSAGMLITTFFGAGTAGTLTGNVVNGNSYGVAIGYDGADISAVVAHSNDLSGNADLALYTVSSTLTADASANWWGVNSASGVAALLYGAVDYTPWFHNPADISGAAGFQGDYSVLDVDDDSPQTGTTGRIQEAIGLVSGSTVNVAAGLYHERLLVNRSLQLLGAQMGVDPTAAGARTDPAAESVVDLVGLGIANPNVLLEIPAGVTNVTIAGFTLNGSTVEHYADEATIRAWDDNVTVEDNIIDGYYDVLCKGNDHFSVLRNRMTANKVGFTVQPGVTTDLTVEGNHILPGGSPAADAQGIYMTGVAGAVIRGNHISGFAGANALGGSNHTNFLIEQNLLAGCKKGVNIWGTTTFIEIRQNVVTGHLAEGIVIKGQDLSIHNNVVSGNDVAVRIGFHVIPTERVTVFDNDLSGSATWALQVDPAVVQAVNASGNWFGIATPAGVAGEVTGLADYTPWLAVGTDTSAAPGFQGDFSTLWVDDAGAQSGTTGRIQEAISLVSGSTVYVAPGLYDERINIHKPMSLLGATVGVNKRGYAVPAGYAYDTATESVIRPSTALELQVVKIAADGVVFDGFVVANEVCQAGGVYQDLVGIDQYATATTGIQVLNCVLGPNTNTAAQDGTMGRSGVTVYGPRPTPIKLAVMHNKIFDSKGNGCGIMFVGPYGPTYSGGAVRENYFAGTVIEDNDILGNHRTGIELAGGVQGGTAWDDHVVVKNNLIAENGWFAIGEKDNLKYGHGIMFIRGGGDKANADGAGARYLRLEGNVIRDNEKSGLYIGPANRDLFGTGNVIQGNGLGTGGYSLWDGVRVDLAELYYGGTALPVYDFLAGVSFTAGQFLANGAQGVNVMQTPTLGPIDVTCDWWGDVLGPNVVPGNPSPGDGITGLATYASWWTTTTGPCDGFVPHVDPVTAGLCISTAHTCVTVPVTYTRSDASQVRGISVTFQLGGGLALCGTPAASILKGTWLTGYDAQYGIVDNGLGSYTVDQAINGTPCGITTGGQLFTLALTGTADGVGTVTVTDVVVRDCDNAPLPGIAGAPGSIPINVSLPARITTLAATQVKTGNDGDGTTDITVSWPAVETGAEVLVYRANYGNYPEYDDAPGAGAEPAVPVAYPPTAPWVHAADVASGTTLTDEVAWPNRGFWYYVAYVKDSCDNVSAVSNMTTGTLNYHLGDVMGSDVCLGNNAVDIGDVSLLGGRYGVAEGHALYLACLDVGPTTNRSVNALPTTDNKVNFEDLMMFAINFGTVSLTTTPVAAVASDAVWVEAPAKVTAGQTFTVSLRLSGSGSLLGLSAALGWDRSIAELVSVEAGELVTSQGGVALSGGGGLVDCALLGADRRLAGDGELARVTFRALGSGAPQVAVGAVDARDAWNRTVELTGTPPTVVPAVTSFAPAMPNPFRGTTTLSYALAKGGAVELAVYGVDGRKVATLASGVQEAGSYRLVWDGRDGDGRMAHPGMYYARLTAPEGRFTRALVLVK